MTQLALPMQPKWANHGAVQVSVRPINEALRILGVTPSNGRDEFDTVGLGKYRDFDDLFERYDEAE